MRAHPGLAAACLAAGALSSWAFCGLEVSQPPPVRAGDEGPAASDAPPDHDAGDPHAGWPGDEAAGDAGDAALVDPSVAWLMPERPACAGGYAAPSDVPLPLDAGLYELSGLVASPTTADLLWLHEDSGTAARLYAVTSAGALLGALLLDGLSLHDPEDIAAAPCPVPDRPCLWLADTGDNLRERDDVTLLAVAEPALGALTPFGELAPGAAWRLPLVYDAGPLDVEALVMAPDASAAYLFEKVDGPSARLLVAAAPFTSDAPNLAVTAATLASPGLPVERGRMITGADLHPSGQRLLVRLYTGVFEYRLDGLAVTQIGQVTPRLVVWGPASELQGEAVAYAGTGLELWTVSEDPLATRVPPLHHFACLD